VPYVSRVDFEARAQELLPDYVRAYFRATAGSGVSDAEGIADWSAVRFRPYSLRDVSTIDTTTTVLGTPVDTPILIAPMAQQIAAHVEGEVAMARAAAAVRTLVGVSTNAAVPFASVAAEGAPWWFQVYLTRDRHLTELLVQRAVEHGASALILTVDMTALLPGAINPRNWADGPGKARLTNLTPAERAAAGPEGLAIDVSIGFDTIGWLRDVSGLPVIVKGVLRGDDARCCVDSGAAGIVVSTHGGRRLGPSISSARALPEVVEAVDGRAEIYADSGLRTGEHIAAALAMGARAVFLGRPLLWALSVEGSDGVRTILTELTAELAMVMIQLGVSRLDALSPDLLASSGAAGRLERPEAG
jgi:4-hydroxymandelate oxidase